MTREMRVAKEQDHDQDSGLLKCRHLVVQVHSRPRSAEPSAHHLLHQVGDPVHHGF